MLQRFQCHHVFDRPWVCDEQHVEHLPAHIVPFDRGTGRRLLRAGRLLPRQRGQLRDQCALPVALDERRMRGLLSLLRVVVYVTDVRPDLAGGRCDHVRCSDHVIRVCDPGGSGACLGYPEDRRRRDSSGRLCSDQGGHVHRCQTRS